MRETPIASVGWILGFESKRVWCWESLFVREIYGRDDLRVGNDIFLACLHQQGVLERPIVYFPLIGCPCDDMC